MDTGQDPRESIFLFLRLIWLAVCWLWLIELQFLILLVSYKVLHHIDSLLNSHVKECVSPTSGQRLLCI